MTCPFRPALRLLLPQKPGELGEEQIGIERFAEVIITATLQGPLLVTLS